MDETFAIDEINEKPTLISSTISSFENTPEYNACASYADICSPESKFINSNFYGSKNFLVGSMGGTCGSLLGQGELDQHFPDHKIQFRIITWNLAAQNPLSCLKYFQELISVELLNEVVSPAEIIVLCTQETPSNRRQILVEMQCVLGPNYVLFTHADNGSLDISIFIQRQLIWYFSVPQYTTISTRSAVQTKGAVALAFILFGTSFLLINSHFKANEKNFSQRVQDYHKILEELDLPKRGFSNGYRHKIGSPMDRFDAVFWAGDLNFRVRKSREEVDLILQRKNQLNIIEELLRSDELIQAMSEGSIFKDFEEGAISFLPTYKFDLCSSIYDSSEKQRVPSYTDRILFKARREKDVECRHYGALSGVQCSDHRPVYGLFSVNLRPGHDNIALSAGAFHREIYIEGNRKRALHYDLLRRKTNAQRTKVCSIQ